MKRHRLLPLSLLSAGVIALIAAHGTLLYYASSHLTLSTTVAAGVIILLVIKLLGLLGRLHGLLRRRSGHDMH